MNRIYNVLNYGAKRDAANSDSTAIQNAIDAANGTTGIVFAPAGYYVLGASLTFPSYNTIYIIGEGANATHFLIASNNVTAFSITGTSTRIKIMNCWIGSTAARTGTAGIKIVGTSSASPCSEILVEGVTVQNLNEPIRWTDVHQSYIHNCRIIQSVASGITSPGISFTDVVSSKVNRAIVSPTTGTFAEAYVTIDGDCDSIWLDSIEAVGGSDNSGFVFQIGAGTTGPRLIRVNNCMSENAALNGYHVASGGRDLRFTQCHAATSGGDGFQVDAGDGVTFQSCLALQNDEHGFFINGGTGTAVVNCIASNNSQDTDNTYDGIRVENGVSHARIIGNRSGDFIFSLAKGQRYGVSVGTGTGYIIEANNDLQGNKTTGFFSAAQNTENRFAHAYVGSKTYNPIALGLNDCVTTTVTVNEAAVGDFAVASFTCDVAGIELLAQVTSACTVSVRFHNTSGTGVNLTSNTLRVEVRKPW